MRDLNASELIHLHEELREQPSPTADVEEQLREIAKHTDAVIYREEDDMFYFPNFGRGWQVHSLGGYGEHDLAMILGAICKECDSKNWHWAFPNNAEAENKKKYLCRITYGWYLDGGLVYGASDESANHAILLAFLNALLAGVVDCECTEWGICDRHYRKEIDAQLAKSDGAFWDNVCPECGGSTASPSSGKWDPCESCNGTGRVRGWGE